MMITVLMKRRPKAPFFAMWGYSKKIANCKLVKELIPSLGTLILDLSDSRTARNKYVLIKLPRLSYFVKASYID